MQTLVLQHTAKPFMVKTRSNNSWNITAAFSNKKFLIQWWWLIDLPHKPRPTVQMSCKISIFYEWLFIKGAREWFFSWLYFQMSTVAERFCTIGTWIELFSWLNSQMNPYWKTWYKKSWVNLNDHASQGQIYNISPLGISFLGKFLCFWVYIPVLHLFLDFLRRLLTWLKALPNGALDPWSCLMPDSLW